MNSYDECWRCGKPEKAMICEECNKIVMSDIEEYHKKMQDLNKGFSTDNEHFESMTDEIAEK